MMFKTLIAAAVAAAFVLPFPASAAGDKADKAASGSSDKAATASSDKAKSGSTAGSASAGGSSGSTSDKASSGATKSDGGAEAMFKSLDKNKDGFMSKEEVKGTPHEKDFSTLDKNHDGKLSRQEHAAAPEHAGKAGTGASGAESKKPQSTSKPAESSSKKY
jgi:hypothetical protein